MPIYQCSTAKLPFNRLNRQVYERRSASAEGQAQPLARITRRCDAGSPSRTRCLTRPPEDPRFPMGEVNDQ
jgi:hypothetical protein